MHTRQCHLDFSKKIRRMFLYQKLHHSLSCSLHAGNMQRQMREAVIKHPIRIQVDWRVQCTWKNRVDFFHFVEGRPCQDQEMQDTGKKIFLRYPRPLRTAVAFFLAQVRMRLEDLTDLTQAPSLVVCRPTIPFQQFRQPIFCFFWLETCFQCRGALGVHWTIDIAMFFLSSPDCSVRCAVPAVSLVGCFSCFQNCNRFPLEGRM